MVVPRMNIAGRDGEDVASILLSSLTLRTNAWERLPIPYSSSSSDRCTLRLEANPQPIDKLRILLKRYAFEGAGLRRGLSPLHLKERLICFARCGRALCATVLLPPPIPA